MLFCHIISCKSINSFEFCTVTLHSHCPDSGGSQITIRYHADGRRPVSSVGGLNQCSVIISVMSPRSNNLTRSVHELDINVPSTVEWQAGVYVWGSSVYSFVDVLGDIECMSNPIEPVGRMCIIYSSTCRYRRVS